jgi:hypothetical protein
VNRTLWRDGAEVRPEVPASSRYLELALPAARRLLGAMDREPDSDTYGSLDREHWAWKFRDFPRTMVQNGVYPLALMWHTPFENNPYYQNPRVLEWICGAMRFLLDRQHANGAVDAFAPNDQDPGGTIFAVHNMAEAFRLLTDVLDPGLRNDARDGIRRGCDFVFTRAETHAFVSNHWALAALAYHDAFELLGDDRYRRRAEENLDLILQNQASEGWYLEYEGPDPGYESLGIFHLAMLWRRTGSKRLLDSLARSIEFYGHCVHPDGSVGGLYGSRNTSLYFPGGFEILSQEIPLAAAVSQFLRDRLIKGNVVTVAAADLENRSPLMAAYLEAAANAVQIDKVPPLPCELASIDRAFPQAGIRVIGNLHYYAVVNGRKGGACRIFDKAGAQIAYEDSGYMVRSGSGRWCSQHVGMSEPVSGSVSNEHTCRGRMTEFRQHIPNPWNFMMLRLANLTLFRSAAIGQRIRDWIVKRLILTKRVGPFSFSRTMKFDSTSITFSDIVSSSEPLVVDEVRLPRTLAAIHMGSSKYFHENELIVIPQPSTREMAIALNRTRNAKLEFRVEFPGQDDRLKRS